MPDVIFQWVIIILFRNGFNFLNLKRNVFCVIGNGPLTKEDVENINKHDIICEINKRNEKEKNNINGTHLFLRSNKKGYHGTINNIPKSIQNVIFITGSESGNLVENKYLNNIKKIDD